MFEAGYSSIPIIYKYIYDLVIKPRNFPTRMYTGKCLMVSKLGSSINGRLTMRRFYASATTRWPTPCYKQ